jgi:hypothetical protein
LRIKAAKVQIRKTTAVRLIAVTSHNIKSSNDMRRHLSFVQRDASHTGTCRRSIAYPSNRKQKAQEWASRAEYCAKLALELASPDVQVKL